MKCATYPRTFCIVSHIREPSIPYLPHAYDTVSPMSLLGLAPELRLQIYKHLLVEPDPIALFVAGHNVPSKLGRSKTGGLQTAITRVCRVINREAVPILYPCNRFQSSWPHVMWFFHQIASRVRFITQICLPLPAFVKMNGSVQIHDIYIEIFRSMRTETNLKTLELIITTESPLRRRSIEHSTAFDTLDGLFKTWDSLREVVIIVEDRPDSDATEDLLRVLAKTGWIVKVKLLPKGV
nr:hypothetical protein CFP56_28724 [Quercus suber]